MQKVYTKSFTHTDWLTDWLTDKAYSHKVFPNGRPKNQIDGKKHKIMQSCILPIPNIELSLSLPIPWREQLQKENQFLPGLGFIKQ